MAYNVTGNWRLGQVIGLCVANVPCPKCGGRKQHKGQGPTAFFWNPNRPIRAVSSYRLLCAVVPYSIIQFFIQFLFSNSLIFALIFPAIALPIFLVFIWWYEYRYIIAFCTLILHYIYYCFTVFRFYCQVIFYQFSPSFA